MKFTPPAFPSNPTPAQWKWWKQCFTDGLTINEITEDSHKLTFLRTYAGHEVFALLQSSGSFIDALDKLDKQFSVPSRIIYSRHQLLTSTQTQGEKINDFVNRLSLLIHNCRRVARTFLGGGQDFGNLNHNYYISLYRIIIIRRRITNNNKKKKNHEFFILFYHEFCGE
jgi:hypothetical protein